MTSTTTLWKPKLHFDTAANPGHVTFDDGKKLRQNVPWLHYVNARWDYDEPEVIKIKIGEWVVVMNGQNLGPLYLAIEERTLVRVRAQPDLAVSGRRMFVAAGLVAGSRSGPTEFSVVSLHHFRRVRAV